MASKWSDVTTLVSEAGDIPDAHRRSYKEVKSAHGVVNPLYRNIKRNGRLKNTAIIAIVRDDSITALRQTFKRPWWKFWKGAARISVTCSRQLQGALDEAKNDPRINQMIMVASDEVSEIDFSVDSKRISSLLIRRCNNKRKSDDVLLIDGSATFHNTHLDDWSARCHHGKLYLGENVGVRVRPNQVPSWAGSTDGLSSDERDRILAYIRSMNETRMEGTWWEQWKGYIAGILAVVVTGTKLKAGLTASTKGFFVSYKFLGGAAKVAAWDVGLKAFGSAAGPAVLIGCAVGAAVYFIPWNAIFSWLARVARSFGTWISELCAKLYNWCIRTQETAGLEYDGKRNGESFAGHGSGFDGARDFQPFPMMA